MGLRCLSDRLASSVMTLSMLNILKTQFFFLFAVLMLGKWKLFWVLKPYVRSPSSINELIGGFLQSGAPVTWSSSCYLEELADIQRPINY